jgi:formate/nitrite transporter FocA (FNT family)
MAELPGKNRAAESHPPRPPNDHDAQRPPPAHEVAEVEIRETKRTETTGARASNERPETGTRLSAKQIHDNVLGSAEEELQRKSAPLLYSAVAAGLTIGFSFLASAFLRMHGEDEPTKHLLAAAGYPLGFVLVILSRNELFTENTLEPVIPLLHRRDRRTFGNMMRLWGLLILGNMLGGIAFALLLAHTNMVPERMRHDMLELSRKATELGFGLTFYRAIFAGWLLAALTWMLAATHERITQILLVFLATAPIAAFEFSHSIAGSVEAFYRAGVGDAAWWSMVRDFVVPALLGNALGGVTVVALLNFGQSRE